jgi:hypothetical protein
MGTNGNRAWGSMRAIAYGCPLRLLVDDRVPARVGGSYNSLSPTVMPEGSVPTTVDSEPTVVV